METLKFECETITPMFLGGANPETPELRTPSIKGSLRFWWRTINGNLSIKDLKEKESEIFGGSGKKEGRSKIIIRVKSDIIKKSKNKFPFEKAISTHNGNNIQINILEYLSFGPCAYDRNTKSMQFNREYIQPCFNFEIIFKFTNEYREDLLKAFKALISFGGLGAKSRNGFGSISCMGLKDYEIKKDDLNSEIPSYTALSKNVRMFESENSYNSWNKALAEIGIAYKYARESLDKKHNYNKRQYIAAPIIVKREFKSFLERHSKPYFLHIKKIDDLFIGQILYIPSKYAEGLDKDINDRNLDHKECNREFLEVCDEFNGKLSKNLKEVEL
jgi:CRISPR-associated protein Cmr1